MFLKLLLTGSLFTRPRLKSCPLGSCHARRRHQPGQQKLNNDGRPHGYTHYLGAQRPVSQSYAQTQEQRQKYDLIVSGVIKHAAFFRASLIHG